MVKEALAGVGPFTFLALRFWLATLALAPMLLARSAWYSPRLLRDGGLAGLLIFGGYAFQTVGLQLTSASKAGFITGLSVVVVPVLQVLYARQPPKAGSVTGVLLATVGLA